MKSYMALLWIILAVLMLLYLIRRNIKMTKILREVLKIIETSEEKCDRLLELMRNSDDKKERQHIMRELLAEERRICNLFGEEDKWSGQGRRIREYIRKMKDYITAAKEINTRWEEKC